MIIGSSKIKELDYQELSLLFEENRILRDKEDTVMINLNDDKYLKFLKVRYYTTYFIKIKNIYFQF